MENEANQIDSFAELDESLNMLNEVRFYYLPIEVSYSVNRVFCIGYI